MAEQGTVHNGAPELERHFHTLSNRYSGPQLRADSKAFCADFCQLVEKHSSQFKLPQLHVLELSLRYFSRRSAFLNSTCEHVLHTLSSLALSVFELLLFFDQKDFQQEELKRFTLTFLECHSALAKHQNIHLHQVERWIREGGPWASHALQAILSESSLPQKKVDQWISCELPVFLELRVRYLLSRQRLPEALALAKVCAGHQTAGQHLFFLQVYLTWLCRHGDRQRLLQEISQFNGSDFVHIIISLENEEPDELLLELNTLFLLQQLKRGDMHYLCQLVCIWTNLHSRLKTSHQDFLQECHQLMLSATNVNSIFPFIRNILAELGGGGIQFCVELCANALTSCLSCDVGTKCLIYKTIALLLPSDLDVCRTCALLVFFQERTLDAYKMVHLLYQHPDQEYHADCSPIGNHVRFEMLQILKKDLYFDPEFWNLITLRTNCLKLMSEKVVSAALEEIMEEKWVPEYCKEPLLRSCKSECLKGTEGLHQAAAKKRHHKDDRLQQGDRVDAASKKLKTGPGRARINLDPSTKRKGGQGSRLPVKEVPAEPLRRSFWQLDRIHDNVVGYGEHRRTTRLSEKNPPKRRIRKPRWLLEDSGTLENNSPLRVKQHSLKHQTLVLKRSEITQVKTKHKAPLNSHLKTRENNNSSNNNKLQKGTSADGLALTCPPQVVLELSLPDNELMATFPDETCNRQRGYPQMLFYRPTVKVPASLQMPKPIHRKEVILRARDLPMFVHLLHCYTRRTKGKGTSTNNQGSVSTITRSSVQGSPPKHDKPSIDMKVTISSQSDAMGKVPQAQREEEILISHSITSVADLCEKSPAEKPLTIAEREATEAPVLERVPEAESNKQLLETKASVRALSESSVEMKVTVASQSLGATALPQPPVLERVSNPQTTDHVCTFPRDISPSVHGDERLPVSGVSKTDTTENMQLKSEDCIPGSKELLLNGEHSPPLNSEKARCVLTQGLKISTSSEENRAGLCEVSATKATESDDISNMSALTLVTEIVTEITRDLENHKDAAPKDSTSKQSVWNSKPNVQSRAQSSSSYSQQHQSAQEETEDTEDDCSEFGDHVETEESKLRYSCTFCHKMFKGSRVVSHAMFHYRKDECMFCGITFKDDLLAMMHLSDHIEKLKKMKEMPASKSQERHISKTKDTSKHKTSVKSKTMNAPSGHRNSERIKKSAEVPKTVSELSPSESRTLRSNDRLAQTPKEPNKLKCLKIKHPIHKVNGHICKKKDGNKTKQETSAPEVKLSTQQVHQQEMSDLRTSGRDKANDNHDLSTSVSTLVENEPVEKEPVCSTKDNIPEAESQLLKTTANQTVLKKNHMDLQEKLCCPVDGCMWFTDLLKNRVALLYHALEDHYGDEKPLELAFRVGNSKCSICTRVLWSFQHFRHHVERHRLVPRHPCLHQGCTARFKSGMEMRRHARRHSPLQAVCCLPGCPQLFICLWALNLHEKEHYSAKSLKSVTKAKMGDECKKPEAEKKPKSPEVDPATKNNQSIKTRRKLRSQTPTKEVTTDGTSGSKEQNEVKDLAVLKKGLPRTAAPYLRLRQTLRKRQTRKMNLAPPRTYKILCSVSKPGANVKLTLKKWQGDINAQRPAGRRKAPLESAKTTAENTRKKKKIKQNSVAKEDQESPRMIPPIGSVINNVKGGGARTLSHKTVARRPEMKLMRISRIKRKTLKCVTTGTCVSQSLGSSSADRGNKTYIGKKCTASKYNKDGPTETKWDKVANSKAVTKAIKQKCPQRKASRKLEKPKSAVEKSEKPKSAVEKSEKPKSAVEKSEKPKSAVEKSEKPKSAVEKSEKPKSAVEKSEKPKSAVEKSEKPKSAVEKSEKPKSAVEPVVVPQDKDEHFGEKSTPQSGIKQVKDVLHLVDPSAANSAETAKLDPMGPPQTGPDVCAPVLLTCTTSGKRAQAIKSRKSKRKEKEKDLSGAPSCSGKVEKCKVSKTKDKHTDSKRRKKNGKRHTSNAVKKVEAEVTQTCSLEVKGEKAKVTCQHSTSQDNCSGSTAEVQEAKGARKSSKATNKSKVDWKRGDAKTLKRKRASVDKGVPKPSRTKVRQVMKTNPEAVEGLGCPDAPGGPSGPGAQGDPGGPGYSIMVNGQLMSDDRSATLKNAFAQFQKRPYMRLPPTAYLDEKYITMPKRRKEMSMFQESQKPPPPEVAATVQRQRCVNCFATFNMIEELHQHLRKCTNLFGFDSDDDGERSAST